MSPSSSFQSLLIAPPGDLIYFLAVFAISAAAFFMSWGVRSRADDGHAGRTYARATGIALLAWAVLMVAAVGVLLFNGDPRTILPPLDRLVHTLVILVLTWAFVTANHERFGRTSTIVLLVLVAWIAIAYLVTGLEWINQATTQPFNQFAYAATWLMIPLGLSALGALLSLIFFRDVRDAPLKLVFFGVLIIGYGLAWIDVSGGAAQGDYAGIPRLAFLSAMVLSLVIVYREVTTQYARDVLPVETAPAVPGPAPVAAATQPDTGPVAALSQASQPANNQTERESAQLMKALGIMLERASPDTIPERIVQAALNTLKAEVGALLDVRSEHYADVMVGIDRTMNRPLRASAINLETQPTLTNAIERRTQRPLYPDRSPEELADLYARFDIDSTGPTYFQPLVSEKELLATLMIGLPYTGRELTDPELELLKGIGIIASNLLSLSFSARAAKIQAETRAIDALATGELTGELDSNSALRTFDEMRAELGAARDQIGQLQSQVTTLRIALDDERSRLARSLGDSQEAQSISQRILTLNASYEQLREERDRLADRLIEVETAVGGTPGNDSTAVMRSLIDVLRREREDLVVQRDRLRVDLDELRTRHGAPLPSEINAVVEQMNDERAIVETERDALGQRLAEVEAQLAALSVQAQVAGSQPDEVLHREVEREKIVQALQTEVANLASDREALTRQRDRIRSERDEMIRKQDSMRSLQARVLAENAAFEQELTEAHDELLRIRDELKLYADERSTLVEQRDRLMAERQALETERDQVIARVEGDRERLQQLGVDGVGALTKVIEDLTAQRAAVERELNDTRTKLAAVEDRLEVAEIRAATLQPQVIYRPDNPDALVGMVQELRTPMTSIVGYVDLLLNESAGILGEMQRKFLLRVSANVHRLSTMMDDLIQLSYLDAGKFTLQPQLVDVIEVLEDAITSAAAPLREKGLTVHLNLDDEAPLVCADRDALQQVIGQLLTNAYLASPPGSELFISARRKTLTRNTNGYKESYDVLEVSFEDRGGGIAVEDQPHVFQRKYKAENPLIQGLGDTGVGLAIARALVEAHSGEIWVDSQQNVGATFHFVLPAEPEAPAES